MFKRNKPESNINIINVKTTKAKPFYGLVVDVDSVCDNNGYITKVNAVEVAYLLNNQLLFKTIPINKAFLNSFPVYSGLAVRFCDSMGSDQNEIFQTEYITRVDKKVNENFPKEIYNIAKKYVMDLDDKEINPTFWYQLDIHFEDKRKTLLKK